MEQDTDKDASHDTDETPDEELLEQGRKRFKQASAAWKKQRQREQDDLRFQVPELQWDPEARRAREGGAAPGVPVPARPCLSVSLLDQPIQQVVNQARNAKLGIQIHPLSPDANDETADVIQGLYRSIERDSRADQARLWAFGRAVPAGMGFYRVTTCYDENGYGEGSELDQVIRIERILNQAAVYFDPSATEADFSDAEYCFVWAWMPVDRFKSLYPKATPPDSQEWTAMEETDEPLWTKGDGEYLAVRIIEYWYKVHDDSEIGVGDQKRKKDDVKVRCAKFTGSQVLEDYPWNGRYIPIIPVLGRELQPFDEERRWVGMIAPNKDGQRAFNYSVSQAVESVALEPKAPFIGYEGQFEGHEAEWQQANIRNWAYLQVKAKTDGSGQLLPLPERAQVDGSKMQLSVGLSDQARLWVQSGTALWDPSIGRSSGKERSGKAIQSLQQQGDEATSDYLAALADISLRYEARVVLDLIPTIYDRPGRVAQILDEQEAAQMVMLNQPYMEDPNSGALVPVEGQGQAYPPGTRHYNLTEGRYAVAVSVGRSYQTRMQAAADDLGQIISSEPQLLPVVGDLYFQNRDFPNAKEVAERMTRWRQHVMPFLDKQDGQSPDPQQVQAQNQAMQAQIQQMGQQMQQMQQALQTEQAKQAAQIQTAQIRAESAVQAVSIKAEADKQIAALRAQIDTMKLGSQHAHDLQQMQHDSAHDAAMAQASVGQEVAKEAGKAAVQAALAPLSMNPLVTSVGKPVAADSGEV